MTDKCPKCGYTFDQATHIEDDNKKPKSGDISFCINCGSTNMFSNKGVIPIDESELTEDVRREIARVRSAWSKTKNPNSIAG